MVTTNPYCFGMGLPDPAMFVGRETELNRAVQLLAGPGGFCVSFLGATRMGKTTLLDRTMALLKAQEASRIPRCVSLTLLRLRDSDTMFQPVVNAICATSPQLPKAGADAFSSDGFLNWLDKTIRAVPTVLFIDDFDDLVAPDELRQSA